MADFDEQAIASIRKEPARESEVQNRITALMKIAEVLSMNISELEDRLVAILRSPKEDIAETIPRQAFETALAQTLEQVVIQMEIVASRIQSIQSRLEV